MSNGDPLNPNKRLRKHRSFVGGRFKVDAPLLVVILLCGLAVGGFIYREIRKNPFGMKTDVYPLKISADYVEGLGFGSHLRCQGFVVGRVREVRPETAEGKLAFSIEARIDPKFSKWRFGEIASVQASVGPSYLGLSAIELTYAGALLEPHVQQVRLRHEDAPDLASAQADAPKIVADVRDIMAMLNRPWTELAKVDPAKATAMERIILNVHDTSERMQRASADLTESKPGSASTIQRIQATAKDLQDAGRDIKEASAKSVQLEEKLSEQVDSLSRDMHLRLANVEYSAFQVLGEKPAERRALGRDIRETAANLSSATAQIDDLLPRIGDTFLGRLLIRRDKKRPPARVRKTAKPQTIPISRIKRVDKRVEERDWK